MNRKQFAFALGASFCLALSSLPIGAATASAQDDPSAGAPAAGGGGGGGGKGAGNSQMKDMAQACRKEARAQGLKPQTHEMRQAVADCIVKQKPGMATAMKCRVEAMDKGMKPGSDDMKAFMKDCRKSG